MNESAERVVLRERVADAFLALGRVLAAADRRGQPHAAGLRPSSGCGERPDCSRPACCRNSGTAGIPPAATALVVGRRASESSASRDQCVHRIDDERTSRWSSPRRKSARSRSSRVAAVGGDLVVHQPVLVAPVPHRDDDVALDARGAAAPAVPRQPRSGRSSRRTSSGRAGVPSGHERAISAPRCPADAVVPCGDRRVELVAVRDRPRHLGPELMAALARLDDADELVLVFMTSG